MTTGDREPNEAVEAAREMRNRRQPITLDIAVQLVDLVASEESPDYVYTRLSGQKAPYCGCVNWEWDDDQEKWVPSCIVGRVFSLVVDIDGSYHGDDARQLNSRFMTDWLTQEGAVFDRTAIDYLKHLQRRQDDGLTWNEAVAGTKEYYKVD